MRQPDYWMDRLSEIQRSYREAEANYRAQEGMKRLDVVQTETRDSARTFEAKGINVAPSNELNRRAALIRNSGTTHNPAEQAAVLFFDLPNEPGNVLRVDPIAHFARTVTEQDMMNEILSGRNTYKQAQIGPRGAGVQVGTYLYITSPVPNIEAILSAALGIQSTVEQSRVEKVEPNVAGRSLYLEFPESSFVRWVRYYPVSRKLTVAMATGIYEYLDVDRGTWDRWLLHTQRNGSAGQFYNAEIKNVFQPAS
jgi:hypothetical protein